MKRIRNYGLVFLVLTLLFTTWPVFVGAFSFKTNPLAFLQRVSEVVVRRASDLVYFLIMQKKYLFDNYTDPNRYPPLNISPEIDEIISSSTATSSKNVISGQPVAVNTTTVSSTDLHETTIKPATATVPTIVPSTPVLIVKTNLVNLLEKPELDYKNNSATLIFTNHEREKEGRKILISDKTLDIVANLRVDDLFNNQYFEHISPTGQSVSDFAKELGYQYLIIGENLALGNFNNEEEIVSAWMDSPGHRANILNERYTELGVAIKSGQFKGEETVIAVQVFGRPSPDCQEPDKKDKDLIDRSILSVQQMQQEAITMYENLNVIGSNPNLDRAYYNQKISEYNYFAKKTNDAIIALKEMIDHYNQVVKQYNSCAGL
jgi:uncharacterized protein YkwD